MQGIVSSCDMLVTPITVPTPYAVGPVNMYLVQGNGHVVLVDAGVNTDEAWYQFLNELRRIGVSVQSIDAVILTHHHEDHAGLLNRILQICKAKVYVHPRAILRLTRNTEYLERRLQFFETLYQRMGFGERGRQRIQTLRKGMYSSEKLKISESFLVPLENSSVSELSNIHWYYTPGHAVDHIVLHDPERGWLFSGDVLLPNISSNAIVEPDESTWQRMHTVSQLCESMKLCANLNANRVFPGHGDVFENHKTLVDYRLNRVRSKAERVLSILADGPMTPAQICEKMYVTKIDYEFALVASEVLGLLDYLHDIGKIMINTSGTHDWCSTV